MILVIADDFTGAAEIAGIAIEFGLKTEIQTRLNIDSDADVLVIDTNTRSRTAKEAETVLEELLKLVSQRDFEFIYKKTDSVLRGHIYEELSVLLRHYPGKSILLVPMNPSKGRTISNGNYYIDGQPLHETVFSDDPESPIRASDVYSLINRGENYGIQILNTFSNVPRKNGMVFVGEAKDINEIDHWVNQLDEYVISAGAADFFKFILKSRKYAGGLDNEGKVDFDSKNTLFVCGSSLSRVVNIEEELFSKNPKVIEVSESEVCSGSDRSSMAEIVSGKVIDHFQSTNSVILFVKTSGIKGDRQTQNIPKCLAAITSTVLRKIQLDELFIEGGTTSSEVVRKVGWTNFKPVSQMGEGIVRMQVVNSPSNFITVKPGSYKWTDDLWVQLKSKHI